VVVEDRQLVGVAAVFVCPADVVVPAEGEHDVALLVVDEPVGGCLEDVDFERAAEGDGVDIDQPGRPGRMGGSGHAPILTWPVRSDPACRASVG
jgi:hypothetical protein